MAFIRCQKLKRDDSNRVLSGSAHILVSQYQKEGKYHSKQIVREQLGRVLWLSDDKKTGIFLSPSRGLVEYSSKTDAFSSVDYDDERLAGQDMPLLVTARHVIFGDIYWLLKFIEKCGIGAALRSAFPDKEFRERLLCHVIHCILRDGGKISCGDFISRSFASLLFPDIPPSSLQGDKSFFVKLGADESRLAYFKSLAAKMKKHSRFGRGHYVDSMPFPNDIEDNPFDALHDRVNNPRLALVLDEDTGIPVWFDIIPESSLGFDAIGRVLESASPLRTSIRSMFLDAGYMSQQFIQGVMDGSSLPLIGKMPPREAVFGYKDLFFHAKSCLSDGRFLFVRGGRLYFGQRIGWTVFGRAMHAYVYVDKRAAIHKHTKYILDHPKEYEETTDSEKSWLAAKFGYFVLLSNIRRTPADILDIYLGRTETEAAFKNADEYLSMLPLSEWTDEAVRGKLLLDAINKSILILLRKEIGQSGVSLSELIGKTQTLMCSLFSEGNVGVEKASAQVREYYRLLGFTPPSSLNLAEFREECGLTV